MAKRLKEYDVEQLSCGHMTYERREGSDVERGMMIPYESASEEERSRATSAVELGFENGRPYVKEEYRFTAHSRPATDAYRSGWDAIYGTRTERTAEKAN